jgi:hypothetical protein
MHMIMLDSVGHSKSSRTVAVFENIIGQRHWKPLRRVAISFEYERVQEGSHADSGEEGQSTKHQSKYTHGDKVICPGTVR